MCQLLVQFWPQCSIQRILFWNENPTKVWKELQQFQICLNFEHLKFKEITTVYAAEYYCINTEVIGGIRESTFNSYTL